jgi:hypothetical protein
MRFLLTAPLLTPRRIALAFVLAGLADALQIAIGPAGWFFFDEIMDVLAMVAMTLLLGFHPLFLPTFIIEIVPFVDMLPTWTACVGAVVMLRKRQSTQATTASRPVPMNGKDSSTVIDV